MGRHKPGSPIRAAASLSSAIVTATSAAIRSAMAAGARAVPLGRDTTSAGLCYLLGALAVTLWLWRDPASRTVAGNPSDADQMAWFFRYSATAVAHLHLPALVTTTMNAPRGVSVMWNPSMLLAGVLLAPVTLLAGPQVSLTVLTTAGFAGSALAMFVVLRRWDVSTLAAALGGFVYGFSPAIVHSAVGHYDLQFIVVPPLIADVVMRLAAGRVSARRGGMELGILISAQLFLDEEILLDTAIAVAVLLLVLGLRSGMRVRISGLGTAARGLGIACVVVLGVAGYPLWVQFFGPLRQYGSPFILDFFKNDLSGFIVPSSLLLIHSAGTAAAAASYQGQTPEYLGYLGGLLLIVLVGQAVWWWHRPVIRALAVTWMVTEVFSLGGTLLVSGHEHPAVKLPWYWVQSLPLLESVLPDRFSLIADGAAAALLAFVIDAAVPATAPRRAMSWGWWRRRWRWGAPWQWRWGAPWQWRWRPLWRSRLRSWEWRPWRWRPRRWGLRSWRWSPQGRQQGLIVAACAVLAVLPIVPRPLPASAVAALPPGWAAVFADLRLPRSATVLTVPIPTPTFTEPLRWQAESGEPSALVGGYFMGPAQGGHVYVGGDGIPAPGQYLNQLWAAGAPGNFAPAPGTFAPVVPVGAAQMRAQLTAWQVTAVVAVTTPDLALARYLTGLLGHPAAEVGDMMAWRLPA